MSIVGPWQTMGRVESALTNPVLVDPYGAIVAELAVIPTATLVAATTVARPVVLTVTTWEFCVAHVAVLVRS
jgi:hypothetical protein